jgi:hypothetical protein
VPGSTSPPRTSINAQSSYQTAKIKNSARFGQPVILNRHVPISQVVASNCLAEVASAQLRFRSGVSKRSGDPNPSNFSRYRKGQKTEIDDLRFPIDNPQFSSINRSKTVNRQPSIVNRQSNAP